MPSHVAYRLYVGVRRGGIDMQLAAREKGVERAWDLAAVYLAAGIAQCQAIIGEALKMQTFSLMPAYPDVVDAMCEDATRALFRTVMTGCIFRRWSKFPSSRSIQTDQPPSLAAGPNPLDSVLQGFRRSATGTPAGRGPRRADT